MEKNQPDRDEKIFNETLKRMLKTPPTPHDGKPRASKSDYKTKPGSPPAKKRLPDPSDC